MFAVTSMKLGSDAADANVANQEDFVHPVPFGDDRDLNQNLVGERRV